jgi:ABC-2 type transport system permease protein
LKLLGGAFEKIARVFPFFHAVEMEKALFAGDFSLAAEYILPILLYGVGTAALAVYCFLGQMKKQ